MVFHLGFELPPPDAAEGLNAEIETFTSKEISILKRQIRKNAEVIDSYVQRLDLFVNREKYPKQELFIEKIRRRMFLLMEENDTFRRALWRQLRNEPVS